MMHATAGDALGTMVDIRDPKTGAVAAVLDLSNLDVQFVAADSWETGSSVVAEPSILELFDAAASELLEAID